MSVFEKFGGIRPLATAIGVPPSTVMSWQRNRKIPVWRHASILQASSELGLSVTERDLTDTPANERTEEAEASDGEVAA